MEVYGWFLVGWSRGTIFYKAGGPSRQHPKLEEQVPRNDLKWHVLVCWSNPAGFLVAFLDGILCFFRNMDQLNRLWETSLVHWSTLGGNTINSHLFSSSTVPPNMNLWETCVAMTQSCMFTQCIIVQYVNDSKFGHPKQLESTFGCPNINFWVFQASTFGCQKMKTFQPWTIPSGKLTQLAGISPFWIGNTSSFRVHVPLLLLV